MWAHVVVVVLGAACVVMADLVPLQCAGGPMLFADKTFPPTSTLEIESSSNIDDCINASIVLRNVTFLQDPLTEDDFVRSAVSIRAFNSLRNLRLTIQDSSIRGCVKITAPLAISGLTVDVTHANLSCPVIVETTGGVAGSGGIENAVVTIFESKFSLGAISFVTVAGDSNVHKVRDVSVVITRSSQRHPKLAFPSSIEQSTLVSVSTNLTEGLFSTLLDTVEIVTYCEAVNSRGLDNYDGNVVFVSSTNLTFARLRVTIEQSSVLTLINTTADQRNGDFQKFLYSTILFLRSRDFGAINLTLVDTNCTMTLIEFSSRNTSQHNSLMHFRSPLGESATTRLYLVGEVSMSVIRCRISIETTFRAMLMYVYALHEKDPVDNATVTARVIESIVDMRSFGNFYDITPTEALSPSFKASRRVASRELNLLNLESLHRTSLVDVVVRSSAVTLLVYIDYEPSSPPTVVMPVSNMLLFATAVLVFVANTTSLHVEALDNVVRLGVLQASALPYSFLFSYSAVAMVCLTSSMTDMQRSNVTVRNSSIVLMNNVSFTKLVPFDNFGVISSLAVVIASSSCCAAENGFIFRIEGNRVDFVVALVTVTSLTAVGSGGLWYGTVMGGSAQAANGRRGLSSSASSDLLAAFISPGVVSMVNVALSIIDNVIVHPSLTVQYGMNQVLKARNETFANCTVLCFSLIILTSGFFQTSVFELRASGNDTLMTIIGGQVSHFLVALRQMAFTVSVPQPQISRCAQPFQLIDAALYATTFVLEGVNISFDVGSLRAHSILMGLPQPQLLSSYWSEISVDLRHCTFSTGDDLAAASDDHLGILLLPQGTTWTRSMLVVTLHCDNLFLGYPLLPTSSLFLNVPVELFSNVSVDSATGATEKLGMSCVKQIEGRRRATSLGTLLAGARAISFATISAATTLSLGSSAASGPWAMTQVQCVGSFLRIKSCIDGATPIGDDSPSFIDNPTQLRVGTLGPQHAGAGGTVIGNTLVLLPAWALAHIAIASIHLKGKHQALKGEISLNRWGFAVQFEIRRNFIDKIVKGVLTPWLMTSQATLTAALSLLAGDGVGDHNASVIGFFGAVVTFLPVACAGFLMYYPQFQLSARHIPRASAQRIFSIFELRWRWAIKSGLDKGKSSGSLIGALRLLVEGYRPKFAWFFFADVVGNTLCYGVVLGVGSSRCSSAALYVALGVAVVMFLVTAAARPYNDLWTVAHSIVMSAASIAVMTTTLVSDDEGGDSTVALIQVLISLIGTLVPVLVGVTQRGFCPTLSLHHTRSSGLRRIELPKDRLTVVSHKKVSKTEVQSSGCNATSALRLTHSEATLKVLIVQICESRQPSVPWRAR